MQALCSMETGGGEGSAWCPGVKLCAPLSTTACLHCFFSSTCFFLMDQESSITFLSCNDVDLIKIFIGFYKIISYILFPGALQGGGRQGREREESILRMRWKRKIFYFTLK